MNIDNIIIDDFEERVLKHPEGFINGNEEFTNCLKAVLKMLYSLSKSLEKEQFGELPELYTDGFDAEGIWEQVRMRVEPFLGFYKKEVAELDKETVVEESDEESDITGSELEEQEDIEDGMNDGDMEEMNMEDMKTINEEGMEEEYSDELEEEEGMEEDEDEEEEEKEEDDNDNDEEIMKRGKDSTMTKPLTDKELWEQMQKFGEFEEERMVKEEEGEDIDDDEDIDMMRPLDEQGDDDDDDEEEEDDDEGDEERQSLKRQISEMEQTLLKPRSWELRGEASGTKRAENDLLQVDLDVERVGISAPVSTVESTLSLEDLIKQRITDQAFDDPIRKVAPRDKEKKAAEEVSTEKNDKGLGEIYEDEYMRQIHNYDGKKIELDKKKKELEIMFSRISTALDRLCNANYTPESAIKSLVVVSSAPALAMEEALPISVSNETQQTPEELYKSKTKVLKGDGEKDQDERRRERKSKKDSRHKSKVQKENDLLDASKYDEGARRVLEKRKVQESLEAKNVKKGVEAKQTDHFKSTEVFKKMQEEVTREIHGYKQKDKKEEKKTGGDSARYKL